MILKHLLLVGIGGAIGSVMRLVIHNYVHSIYPDFLPLGTLVVNILGCFVIGALYGIAANHALFTFELRLLLMTGICGGFTTFSSFSLEGLALLEQNKFVPFILYFAGSVILGLAATFFGAWITR